MLDIDSFLLFYDWTFVFRCTCARVRTGLGAAQVLTGSCERALTEPPPNPRSNGWFGHLRLGSVESAAKQHFSTAGPPAARHPLRRREAPMLGHKDTWGLP